MSRIGRACAIAACVLGVVTLATWDRGQQAAVADVPVVVSSVADGAQLFQAKGCASCHDGPDSRARMVDFPSLANASSWASDRREGLSAAQYVTESIRDPSAFISPVWIGGGPTTAMPDLRLSEAEIAAVVAYLLGPD